MKGSVLLCVLLPLITIIIAFTRAQTDGDIRLVDFLSTNASGAGRLEIYLRGQWGTVCDDFFGLREANTSCRQLGYPSASRVGTTRELRYPLVTTESTAIWLDDVMCGLRNTTLLSCSNRGIGVENCVHSEDVALICTGANYTMPNGELRLVNSSSTNATAGRLDIFLQGQWGTVCDDGFGLTEANVVCRYLGLPTQSTGIGTVSSLSFYPQASSLTPIWLDDVDCSASESLLLYCDHRGAGINNCVHSEDVVVSCGTPAEETSDGELRLVDSRVGVSAGRLEIFLRGEWGTVCDDGFGTTEGEVACSQLGFRYVLRVGRVRQLGYLPGSSSTEIWLDNVDCSSSDTTLLSCDHNGIGVHNCDHSEDVGLACSNNRPSRGLGGGAVTGIVIGSMVFVALVIIPTMAYSHYRRRIRLRQRPLFNSSAITTATREPLLPTQEPQLTTQPPQGQYMPYKPPHAQEAPPAHPSGYKPLLAEEPPPQPTLQEAPPPSYNQATAYLPPSNPSYPPQPAPSPSNPLYPPQSTAYPPQPAPYLPEPSKEPSYPQQQQQPAGPGFRPHPSQPPAPYPEQNPRYPPPGQTGTPYLPPGVASAGVNAPSAPPPS